MGGGGGFSPISIISDIIFGAASGLSGGAHAGAQSTTAQVADDTAAEEQAAEARRKADRQKAEAALLSKARQSDRAEQAGRDAVAQTLGSPSVEAAQLKARLGQ